MEMSDVYRAEYHLPGLFEFYDFYRVFLPLYFSRREYFYDWCGIGSVYGAPSDCLWSGGRFGGGEADDAEGIMSFFNGYGISARLTFSNSLLKQEHLSDRKCNELCRIFAKNVTVRNGVIVHSDILLEHLKRNYGGLYFVSSTTKVMTDFQEFRAELDREEFRYIVPDFRLNKKYELLNELSAEEKSKTEFLCNECCYTGCTERRECYENVSRRILGENCPEHRCSAQYGNEGYRFSRAMENPQFIGINDILEKYLPDGFTNFKLEGRGLGNAVLLEFLLYYMVRPEYHIHVREQIYLDSMLDLF